MIFVANDVRDKVFSALVKRRRVKPAKGRLRALYETVTDKISVDHHTDAPGIFQPSLQIYFCEQVIDLDNIGCTKLTVWAVYQLVDANGSYCPHIRARVKRAEKMTMTLNDCYTDRT